MVTALSSTTLSAALDNKAIEFAVSSTTGMSAASSTAPGTILVVGAEAMLVKAIPVSGTVQVMRGYNGTHARAHASGATVFFGAASQFSFTMTTPGPGYASLGVVGLAGDPGVLPSYRLPLGIRQMDPDTGYEYLLVDYQAVFAVGDWVVIDNAGLASAISTSSKGRVGVIVETTVSDNWGWALVVGSVTAKFTSDVTTACVLKAGSATVDISNSTGGNVIYGASCTAAPSSATDLGTAYLSNPWVYGLTTDIIP
jgi:hypothetical protein